MKEIYSVTFRVSSTDVDMFNNIRPSAILSYFQQFGTEHASILKMDRDYLVENYHACWILARVWYTMDRPVGEGDVLTMRTWCRGADGLILYRDYDIMLGGERIGEGVAAWVIADLDTRTMLRPSAIENIAMYHAPECSKSKQLKLIRTPKAKHAVYNRQIRFSDLDVNGHMNNTRYADVIMDVFSSEELKDKFLSQFQLNYSLECKAGEILEISGASLDSGFYVDGCCDDGKRRFEATIRFAELTDKNNNGDMT